MSPETEGKSRLISCEPAAPASSATRITLFSMRFRIQLVQLQRRLSVWQLGRKGSARIRHLTENARFAEVASPVGCESLP